MAVKVLIVDDSKLARIVLRRTIASLRPDWECIEASNGDEALATLGQERVDVTIIDYNMPGKNGLELAEALRERFADMPVAIATANLQDEIISGARRAQATFIAKPVNEDSLRGFLSGAQLKLGSSRT